MKFGLKLIALAAALASAAGAQAQGWPESSNPQVAFVAYNQTTRAWFIQDMGFTMNSFLPAGTVLGEFDGPVQGTVTPETGLTINQSFSGWGEWYAQQSGTASAVRWFVAAADAENFFDGNETRLILTSKSDLFPPGGAQNNIGLTDLASGGLLGGLGNLFPQGVVSGDGTSSVGPGAPVEWDNFNNWGSGAGALALVGDSVGLYYHTRSGGAFGDDNAAPNRVRYGNSEFFATVSFNEQGSFQYDLQPVTSPIPLPASVWLMGAGLAALGGVMRRRRAAAQA